MFVLTLITIVAPLFCLPINVNPAILFDGRFQQFGTIDGVKHAQPGVNGYQTHIFRQRINNQDGFKYLSFIPSVVSANDKSALQVTLDNDSIFQPNDANQHNKIIRSDLVQRFDASPQIKPSSGILAYFVSVKAPFGFISQRLFQMIFMESNLFKLQVQKNGDGSSQMQFNVEGKTAVIAPFEASTTYNFCILVDLGVNEIDLLISKNNDPLKHTMQKTVKVFGNMDISEFHIGMLVFDNAKATVDATETLVYSGTEIANFPSGSTADDFNRQFLVNIW